MTTLRASLSHVVLRALEESFARWPDLVAGPATEQSIDDLEAAVGFPLAGDYKEFVRRFGAGIVGPYAVYGLGRGTAMGKSEDSALRMTKHFRDDKWPCTDRWLIVSTDHGGNPVGLDAAGCVWMFDHDFGGLIHLADSFSDFLERRCLRLPAGVA